VEENSDHTIRQYNEIIEAMEARAQEPERRVEAEESQIDNGDGSSGMTTGNRGEPTLQG
jgi:hypothetical protein